MITRKQLSIFEVFVKKPFNEHTRNDIKRAAREKSNNALALALKQLKKESVITEKKVGRSGVFTLNLDNELTFYYLALCNEKRINSLVKKSLTNLKKELTELTPFYSIVIFGSYATGEEKKESDLDTAVFIESNNKKRAEALINNVKLKSPINMDVHVITKDEMIEMLTNKEENLGKQIARKHLAAHNHVIFYDLIKDGFNNGFRA